MADLDEQLLAFGRWLDAEVAERVDAAPPYVQPSARRHHRAWLIAAAAAATLIAGVTLALVSRSDLPDVGPNIPTPAPTLAPTTASTSPTTTTTAASTTTITVPPMATPASSSPPPASVVVANATTTRPATSTSTSVEATSTTPGSAPIPDTPSVPPTPETTAAPATTPAPEATAPGLVCNPYVHPVKRVGTISVRACVDGIHFVTASVANGSWSATPLEVGPPTVVVRFTSSTGTVYTCSITGNADAFSFSGDC